MQKSTVIKLIHLSLFLFILMASSCLAGEADQSSVEDSFKIPRDFYIGTWVTDESVEPSLKIVIKDYMGSLESAFGNDTIIHDYYSGEVYFDGFIDGVFSITKMPEEDPFADNRIHVERMGEYCTLHVFIVNDDITIDLQGLTTNTTESELKMILTDLADKDIIGLRVIIVNSKTGDTIYQTDTLNYMVKQQEIDSR